MYIARLPEHLLALVLEVCSCLSFPQLLCQQLLHLLSIAVGDGLCCHTSTYMRECHQYWLQAAELCLMLIVELPCGSLSHLDVQ